MVSYFSNIIMSWKLPSCIVLSVHFLVYNEMCSPCYKGSAMNLKVEGGGVNALEGEGKGNTVKTLKFEKGGVA